VCLGLRRSPQPRHPLVHHRRQYLVLPSDLVYGVHYTPERLPTNPIPAKPLIPARGLTSARPHHSRGAVAPFFEAGHARPNSWATNSRVTDSPRSGARFSSRRQAVSDRQSCSARRDHVVPAFRRGGCAARRESELTIGANVREVPGSSRSAQAVWRRCGGRSCPGRRGQTRLAPSGRLPPVRSYSRQAIEHLNTLFTACRRGECGRRTQMRVEPWACHGALGQAYSLVVDSASQ